jgi:hypothetical protein
MEHSPSWEANSSSVSQQIPYILWNPKVHCHVHNWPPVHIWSQINSIHALLNEFCKINFNTIHPSMPSHPSGLFPSRFSTKTLYASLVSPIRAACPSHLILIHLITPIIFGEAHGSRRSSLCSVIHSRYLVPLMPKYSPQTLLSSALSLCSSLNVTRPRFTPTQNKRKNYCSVYFNIYIFGQPNGRLKILQQMIASISWLQSALISSWMQFWFVRVVPKYLNFATLSEGLSTILHCDLSCITYCSDPFSTHQIHNL